MEQGARPSAELPGAGADAAAYDRHSHDQSAPDHVHEAVVPDGSRAPEGPALRMPRLLFLADGLREAASGSGVSLVAAIVQRSSQHFSAGPIS
jgi:hypothetical protein